MASRTAVSTASRRCWQKRKLRLEASLSARRAGLDKIANRLQADPDLAAEAAAAAGAADSVDSLLAEEEWPTKCLKYITKLEVR